MTNQLDGLPTEFERFGITNESSTNERSRKMLNVTLLR